MCVNILKRKLFIKGVGDQSRWADYFEHNKLFKEVVGGKDLFNATWRNGSDRHVGGCETNNLSEQQHNYLKTAARRVAKFKEVNKRPTLPELIEVDIF